MDIRGPIGAWAISQMQVGKDLLVTIPDNIAVASK